MTMRDIIARMEELEEEINDYTCAIGEVTGIEYTMVLQEEIQIREEEMERLRKELNKAWLKGED